MEKLGDLTGKRYKAAAQADIEAILNELRSRHEAIFRAVHEHSVGAAAAEVLEALALEIEFSLTTPGAVRYLEDVGARLVRGINDETAAQLGKALSEGLAAGENTSALGDRVRAVFAEASRSRATTISVTETTKALGFGSLEAYRQTEGVVDEKEWQTAGDGDVREAHVEAGGQLRRIDQPYDVDGEQLMYPGDPSGSAGNVVNCRCANLPVLNQASLRRLRNARAAQRQYQNGGAE